MESEQTGLAFSLPPSPERARANSPVEFLHDFLFPSPKAHDFVSFGLDDVLHTAASDSEDFGPALADALPPSGQEARPSAAYSELVNVLLRATEKLSLDWPDEPRESRASKLDECFLIGAHSKLERRKLPFFSDLHREISSSWKQTFSSRLTNAAAADFTNLVGSVEQGYTAMPVIEDTLASHLSPSLAPSWKSRPLLPSKPCRTTSALILSTSFRSQVVTLHSFHPPPFASSEDERLHLLCPVRALKLYVDRSKVWRKSPQLLICFGAGRRGACHVKAEDFSLGERCHFAGLRGAEPSFTS